MSVNIATFYRFIVRKCWLNIDPRLDQCSTYIDAQACYAITLNWH